MEPYEPLLWEYGTKSPAELLQTLTILMVKSRSVLIAPP